MLPGPSLATTLTASRNGFRRTHQEPSSLGVGGRPQEPPRGPCTAPTPTLPKTKIISSLHACLRPAAFLPDDPSKTSPMQRAQDPARSMSSGGSTPQDAASEMSAPSHLCRLKIEMNRDGGGGEERRRRAGSPSGRGGSPQAMETGNHVADQMETLKVRAFIRAHTHEAGQ